MSNDLVTIARFSSAPPAHLLMTKLEAEGIQSFINDESIVTLNPLISNAVGGVKVKVSQVYVDKAIEVLQILKNPNDGMRRRIEYQLRSKGFELASIYCPSCESALVYHKKTPQFFFILGFILAVILGPLCIFLLLIKRTYTCADCGNSWKQR